MRLLYLLSLVIAAGPVFQEKEPEEKRSGTPKSARWQVSFSVDPFAARMSWRPHRTTVANLVSFKRPSVLPKKGKVPQRYRAVRVGDVERTLWRVRATVVNVAAEHDGDYRLILSDAQGRLVTCVLPDPSLAPKKSQFTPKILVARDLVLKRFKPAFAPRNVHVPIEATGLGYFGRLNSDANPSPEGFQLRALEIRFLPSK